MASGYYAPQTFVYRPPRAPSPSQFTMPTIPGLPTVPVSSSTTLNTTTQGGNPTSININDPSIPQSAQIGLILGNGTTQNPGLLGLAAQRRDLNLTAAKNQAKNALAGYGQWSFSTPDDPSTPNVDESLVPTFNPDAIGQRERGAIQTTSWAMNAKNALHSSFANKAVGAALGQVSREAQSILQGYSGAMANILNGYASEVTGYTHQLGVLYGEAMQWLAQNPIPDPPAQPAPAPVQPTDPQQQHDTGQIEVPDGTTYEGSGVNPPGASPFAPSYIYSGNTPMRGFF